MKYMVMECHLSYAVVLDENGRFLKVANQNFEVGQTVTEVIEMQVPQAPVQKKKPGKWVYSAAAMAACLAVTFTTVLHLEQRTYASVYMTINPEVRIDVNRKDRVVDLDGVNADGEQLIKAYDYKKKDLDLVMDELVDKAIAMGYLHGGDTISLVFDADNEEWVVEHSDALPVHMQEYLTEKLEVTIEVSDQKNQIHQVLIPVTPPENISEKGDSPYESSGISPAENGDSVYGESVYGESAYGESAYGDSAYGDTAYGDSAYGESAYGASAYGESAYGDSAYGESDYSESNHGTGSGGDSSYEAESSYGESSYENNSSYGESSYEKESSYGESSYEKESSYGDSSYEADSDYDD